MTTRSNVAAVILNNKSEVLLTQRASTKKFLPGAWHLPGGKIEAGESRSQALQREIQEELSLQIEAIINLELSFKYPAGDDVHQTFFFLVKTSGVVILDFESMDYKFVKLWELREYLNDQSLNKSTAAVLKSIKISRNDDYCSTLK